MNRTIKEATVKRYHYDNHDQLRTHLADFIAAYNYARCLKTLSGLTPYEYICEIWTSEPDLFHLKSDPPDAGTEHLIELEQRHMRIAIFALIQPLKSGRRMHHSALFPDDHSTLHQPPAVPQRG